MIFEEIKVRYRFFFLKPYSEIYTLQVFKNLSLQFVLFYGDWSREKYLMVKEVVLCQLQEGFFSLQKQHGRHIEKSKELPWTQLQGNETSVKSLQGKENKFLRFEIWLQAKKLDSSQGLLSFPNPFTMLGEVCSESRLTYSLQWIMHSLDPLFKIWD